MDEKWIYGDAIGNIAAAIREGRPNGMPLFRGRIPEDRVWQISAHIRSMGRSMGRYVPLDSLHPRPAENRQPRAEPGPAASFRPPLRARSEAGRVRPGNRLHPAPGRLWRHPRGARPSAPEAGAIVELFWLFTTIAVAIRTAVVIALAAARMPARRIGDGRAP